MLYSVHCMVYVGILYINVLVEAMSICRHTIYQCRTGGSGGAEPPKVVYMLWRCVDVRLFTCCGDVSMYGCSGPLVDGPQWFCLDAVAMCRCMAVAGLPHARPLEGSADIYVLSDSGTR